MVFVEVVSVVSVVNSLIAGKAAVNLSSGTVVLLQVDLLMTFSSPTVSIETSGSSAVILALVGARGISRVVVSQCFVSLRFE